MSDVSRQPSLFYHLGVRESFDMANNVILYHDTDADTALSLKVKSIVHLLLNTSFGKAVLWILCAQLKWTCSRWGWRETIKICLCSSFLPTPNSSSCRWLLGYSVSICAIDVCLQAVWVCLSSLGKWRQKLLMVSIEANTAFGILYWAIWSKPIHF